MGNALYAACKYFNASARSLWIVGKSQARLRCRARLFALSRCALRFTLIEQRIETHPHKRARLLVRRQIQQPLRRARAVILVAPIRNRQISR